MYGAAVVSIVDVELEVKVTLPYADSYRGAVRLSRLLPLLRLWMLRTVSFAFRWVRYCNY